MVCRNFLLSLAAGMNSNTAVYTTKFRSVGKIIFKKEKLFHINPVNLHFVHNTWMGLPHIHTAGRQPSPDIGMQRYSDQKISVCGNQTLYLYEGILFHFKPKGRNRQTLELNLLFNWHQSPYEHMYLLIMLNVYGLKKDEFHS